jgi:hypothetical protein
MYSFIKIQILYDNFLDFPMSKVIFCYDFQWHIDASKEILFQ